MYLFIQSLETVDNSEHSCVKFSLGNVTNDIINNHALNVMYTYYNGFMPTI